ncbi:hypothetical protein BS50DRAFT_630964 [Corynespora cassiicola Philippines]|uniref:Ras modification protein ERF4 n=1 Tax=Corynespora cassiicola Philippines TaxID=1448308 RepID=A0A2T2NZR3_CORCC|nr:hypothetical protein BS50DRAFT_630964 [Corynespora cassiicola Philippines]
MHAALAAPSRPAPAQSPPLCSSPGTTSPSATAHAPAPTILATTASHGESVLEQETAPPVRWSLTNRIFGIDLSSLYHQHAPPRQPSSRLWNPINSSPRQLALPNVPVQRPRADSYLGRDEYPLLTLPEQRRSRQSPANSSLVVERSTGGDSASVGLPRDRNSLPPHSPRLNMPVEPQPVHAAARPGAPADEAAAAAAVAPGVTNPADDPDAKHRRSEPGRISLPGSRPASMHSRTASAHGEGDGDGDDTSEYAWGPSHPCFPHLNPHVPMDSELYESTRIIRIRRDWMVKGDLAPTFANLYPEILDPLITEDEFRRVVKKINDTLVDVFNPFSFRAWLDAVMGVATFWLWDDAGLTHVKRQLADLERWIEDWNHECGEKEGVKIIPLRRTGYLTLDFQIPDPHLGPDTGTSSRPGTDDYQNPTSQQQQSGYNQYPVTPTLQVSSGSPVAIPS